MRVTARVDYAVRAMLELAAVGQDNGAASSPPAGRGGRRPSTLVKLDRLASSQAIPPKFLEHILTDLRRSGLIVSQRGSEGGYRLARPAEDVSLADVIRAVEGPLANVRGEWPEEVEYAGAAEALQEVWIAVRANLRAVLESVTLADIADGNLPKPVTALTRDPQAWVHH